MRLAKVLASFVSMVALVGAVYAEPIADAVINLSPTGVGAPNSDGNSQQVCPEGAILNCSSGSPFSQPDPNVFTINL